MEYRSDKSETCIACLKDFMSVIGGECFPSLPENNGESISTDCFKVFAL
jgi:hypothetical protein